MSSLSVYPDDNYTELKETIARLFRRNENEICVGNGSVEIIRSFCHSHLSEGDLTCIEPHTFGEYALSVKLAGGRCISQCSPDERVRFICNPNNPTGLLQSREEITKQIRQAETKDELLFIDEAFIELSDPEQSVIDIHSPNLFVLRSLTKSFAVPGIRFGFGCGDPDIVQKIEVTRPPWSVNSFAVDFALNALRHYNELKVSRERIKKEREWLCRQFDLAGIEHLPSSVNFILINLGHDAAPVVSNMAEHNILIRDCSSFGLPSSIRVAVRTRDENRCLVEAITECLH